jgi:hypothetical protein
MLGNRYSMGKLKTKGLIRDLKRNGCLLLSDASILVPKCWTPFEVTDISITCVAENKLLFRRQKLKPPI